MALFSKEEADKLSKQVQEVELGTAGELVLATVRRSDDYGFARGLTALLLSATLGWALHEHFAALPTAWFFLALPALWLAFYGLLAFPPVLRRIVPIGMQNAAVERRTRQLFMELGVTETRDRSGVLIVLSETERKVHLLADRGIHERVGTSGWEKQVSQVAASMRRGEAAQGLSVALEQVGEMLAAHFPPRADDTNELPDAVRQLD